MKYMVIISGLLSFAFAQGQTGTIKVRKDSCRCEKNDLYYMYSPFYDTSRWGAQPILRGKIVSIVDSLPVRNVKVSLYSGKTLMAYSCTDSAGMFIMVRLPEGSYHLQLIACNFAEMGVEAVTLKKSKITAYLDPPLFMLVSEKKKRKNK
jgi:hypothetical protein